MAYKSFISSTNLDTYATGSFTPAVQGSGTAGSPTYANRSGEYVKYGQLVFMRLFINLTNLTGATGDIEITGLPFTSLNVTGLDQCFDLRHGNLTYASGDEMLLAYVQPNSTTITIRSVDDAGGAEAGVGIDTSFFININGPYIVEP